jgi:branched-chain amino acid transport system permease protein
MIPESILVQGLISGVTYALNACGYTLACGVTRILNLAHGSFYMLGAYIFFVLGSVGLDPITALIIAPIIVGLIGIVCYILCLRPIIDDMFGIMIVTVALALIFQQLLVIVFGPVFMAVAPIVSGSLVIGRTGVTYSRILSLLISIGVFFSLWLLTMKSKTGTALRALSQDKEVTMLMGINVKKLYAFTIFLSTLFAALAGVLIISSVTRQLTPTIWLRPLSLAFSVVILGGLGSIKGSFFGGIVLGYVETIVVSIMPGGSYLVDLIVTIMVLGVLVIRPTGLFGKHVERV